MNAGVTVTNSSWAAPGPPFSTVRPTGSGLLDGLTFAVKDVLDIAGRVTGAGNPTWRRTHPPARASAAAVRACLDAGATLVGSAITDELAYSLSGTNVHDGTPINPAAPGHVPGGSSAGSASAVAAKAVDFALATDTGGSIRVPASYCGLYGLRPTHGRTSQSGVLPMCPTFDTVGWFTRDAELLGNLARVLLDSPGEFQMPDEILIALDAFAMAEHDTRSALLQLADRAASLINATENIRLCDHWANRIHSAAPWQHWLDSYQALSRVEVWRTYGPWIEQHRPQFGPGVAQRFRLASAATLQDAQAAQPIRSNLRQMLTELLGSRKILAIPATPGPAPRADENDGAHKLARRDATLKLTCLAGMTGAPALVLPTRTRDSGLPVGLCLIAAPGHDELLIGLAGRLSDTHP